MEEKLIEIKEALGKEIEELSHLKSLDVNTKHLARILELSKKEWNSDFFTWKKHSFECLIDGMIMKIHMKYNKSKGVTAKTPKALAQLAKLEEMKDFLELMTERLLVMNFQARQIQHLERQNGRLHMEKQEVIAELDQLKENIEDE